MKKSIAIVVLLAGAAVSAQATMWNVTTNMDMAQHGLSGAAVGQMTGTYDDLTNIWTINSMTATALSGNPSASHLHLGALGVNGSVLINTGTSYSLSGNVHTYTGTAPFNVLEANEAAFLSGGTYINIHTAQNPGGEIRGQVIAEAVPEPATMAILALGAAAALKRKKRLS